MLCKNEMALSVEYTAEYKRMFRAPGKQLKLHIDLSCTDLNIISGK